jgi:acetyltransferase-like isoleucine patch superfamily enzyme
MTLKARILTRLLGRCPGAVGLFLRQKLYPGMFEACGRKVLFGWNIRLVNPAHIRIGEHAVVGDHVTIAANDGGRIEVGANAFIGGRSKLEANGGVVRVGEGANMGSMCRVLSRSRTRIGNDVLLAAFCTVGESAPDGETHREPAAGGDAGPPAELECRRDGGPLSPAAVGGETEVEDGCWLGVRASVRAGGRVGHDAIVGAYAVVQYALPPFSISVGNPAKVMRTRA